MFKDFLKNYISLFGKENIVVRPYQKQYFINGDVVADLVCLIDENLLIHLNQDSNRLKTNESLSVASARLCLAIAKTSNPNLNRLIFEAHYGRQLRDIPSRVISLTTSQTEYN